MPTKAPLDHGFSLIVTRVDRLRHPLEEIHEFEAAIIAAGRWPLVFGPAPIPPLKIISRIVFAAGSLFDLVARRLFSPKPPRNFVALGYIAKHHLIYRTFPYFSIPFGLRALWMYDAWEGELCRLEIFFRRHSINVLLVTSRQAADYFNQRNIPRFKAYWIPEAVTVSVYKTKPYSERTIDVLQFGRRWDEYHTKIERFCCDRKLVYLYEKTKGEIIFPTREDFLESLADSKISICVPSSITHPERSGKIATLTWRYFQSMASKCLILGRAPEEMRELFDYNPVIEIDLENATEQLDEVLANFAKYVDLIEQNYSWVEKHHQWSNRTAQMDGYLREFVREQNAATEDHRRMELGRRRSRWNSER